MVPAAKISITGLGIVSAIGCGVEENRRALVEGQSGIGTTYSETLPEGLLVGAVKQSDQELLQRLRLPNGYYSRTSLLGMVAAREAWDGQSSHPSLRTGFIGATSVGGMDQTEQFYKQYLQGRKVDFKSLITHDSGYTMEVIAQDLGLTGYVNTISTACSSSANAIMLGARLLQQGRLDRVLVGGVDPLSMFTIQGFRSLMIYDEAWCKPFDDARVGLNLGEGAAFMVLENEKSIEITGRLPICRLTGWANAADAYHQTASSPDGKGATLAIGQALQKAGLFPEEVSYINVHGTGTKNNDLSESIAMQNIFGDKLPPFSSTKAYTGHTLAAAAAIEGVYSVLALRDGMLLPNLNFSTPLAETGLSPIVELQTGQDLTSVLSNSFGFGGNNSSLVFSSNGY
ncbi:3-oxoacyl-[acyl-carrier-protein] synthase-1 [Dyadobacter jejuensis]|uniref:3-oxoacyl-[acyl-carrier-protein] synthase-1 n=1 Tax=Dyadobacter jejuensis TaxID=1082580 RepID=A0A316AN69_9BACT|nr:beta-ketoacyl-[acyl-carrier-protein] synthase family protein [Dyadobacter jejuensis]PWJ58564.1 3-oxoacyl-[acyl-carrier-protein] synthase-1 [Dyadobacter jejuensis]